MVTICPFVYICSNYSSSQLLQYQLSRRRPRSRRHAVNGVDEHHMYNIAISATFEHSTADCRLVATLDIYDFIRRIVVRKVNPYVELLMVIHAPFLVHF
jgi:hypothetical protein